MMTRPEIAISRRGLLHTMAAAAVATQVAATEPAVPADAWVITEQNWDNSDDGNFPVSGHYLQHDFFTDLAVANAYCKKLNDLFYASWPTPIDFNPNWVSYFSDGWPKDSHGNDIAEDEITWEQLRAAGWDDPFEVVPLTKRDRVAD